jgi:hypothetical protein
MRWKTGLSLELITRRWYHHTFTFTFTRTVPRALLGR